MPENISSSCLAIKKHSDGQTIQQGGHFQGLSPNLEAHRNRDICLHHQSAPTIGQDFISELCQMILLGSHYCCIFTFYIKFPISTFASLLQELVPTSIGYADEADFPARTFISIVQTQGQADPAREI
jgi:hypothetical protein